MHDLLKADEQLAALVRIGFDRCRLEQLIDLRICVVRGVRERQTDLEILRPENALYANSRVEGVRKRLERDVECAVRIGLLHLRRKGIALNLGVGANARKRLAHAVDSARFLERVVEQPQRKALGIRATLESRRVERCVGLRDIVGKVVDTGPLPWEIAIDLPNALSEGTGLADASATLCLC